jgi:23S rRNA (uracil1939-C5)-methyltransferase
MPALPLVPSTRESVDCDHARTCAGCPGIGSEYDEQLAGKAATLLTALHRYPELARVPVLPICGAPTVFEYRTRVKLVAAGGELGLFEPGSHRVVDIPRCRIMTARLSRVATALRELLAHASGLTAVDLREVDDGVFVTLIVTPAVPVDVVREWSAELRSRSPEVISVARSDRDPESARVLGSGHVIVDGPEIAKHHLTAGLPWHYAAHGAFVQAHAQQAGALYGRIVDVLAQRLGGLAERRIVELYAGSGVLALALARRGADVVAVESYSAAATRISRAAEEQGLRVRTQVTDAAAALSQMVAQGAQVDAVLVNPPRRGLAPSVRANIAALRARVTLYVSCSPETLARDLDALSRLRATTVSVVGLDMIPLSDAVEALAELAPGELPRPAVLHADERLIAVVKAAHEATAPQREAEPSLLARVRSLPNASEAVPVHRLDGGTSGVCLFARRPEHVAELARALAEGSREYVALAKGVTRPKGTISRNLPEEGRLKDARSRYKRLRVIGGHSLVLVRPEQGRWHQVRRHLASVGHPVLGDARYGDRASNLHFEMRHGLDRPFLHCQLIRIRHAGDDLELRAELTADLAAVLESLAGSARARQT